MEVGDEWTLVAASTEEELRTHVGASFLQNPGLIVREMLFEGMDLSPLWIDDGERSTSGTYETGLFVRNLP